MPKTTERRLPGGVEWRLETEHGVVMVFIPDGYRDGVVLYVHGFFDNVESAWRKQRLPEQFLASGVKAMFIAPEAKSGSADKVRWSNLTALLDTVSLLTGVTPKDPVVAIGHSGAFENIAKWLGNPRLVHITLLDAFYGSVAAFRDWANRTGNTLTLLVTRSGAPRTNAEAALPTFFSVVRWAGVPDLYEDFSPAAKHAKTLYIVANETHMQLVEGRPRKPVTSWVIPVLLRRTPVGAGLSTVLILGGLAAMGLLLYHA